MIRISRTPFALVLAMFVAALVLSDLSSLWTTTGLALEHETSSPLLFSTETQETAPLLERIQDEPMETQDAKVSPLSPNRQQELSALVEAIKADTYVPDDWARPLTPDEMSYVAALLIPEDSPNE